MKFFIVASFLILFSICIVFGQSVAPKVNNMFLSNGGESGYVPDNPPPIDSICLVFSGIDYGANFNSPQAIRMQNTLRMLKLEVITSLS